MDKIYRKIVNTALNRIRPLWVNVAKLNVQYLKKPVNIPIERKLRRMSDSLILQHKKILYKDDNFLAIDKDFDVKMESESLEDVVSLDKQLRASFPELCDDSVFYGFRFQQRLDNATSGVVMISLNKSAAANFAKNLTKRNVMKHYVALVHGHVEPTQFMINVPLCRHVKEENEPYKMKVAEDKQDENSKDCKTFGVKLETGTYNGSPATKLLLVLFTGRTHQLRVHCKHLGHLIIGDYTYSNRQDTEPYRMMLHSYRLRLPISQTQTLDIKTDNDPFESRFDPKWQADQTHITYDDSVKKFYDNDYKFVIPDENEVKYYEPDSS